MESGGGRSVASEGLWERKRLYFRRSGAHSECASPTMRIASRGRWEIWRAASLVASMVDVEREVEGELGAE